MSNACGLYVSKHVVASYAGTLAIRMEKGIKEQVAELIRESRKAKSLTLKELGERIGVAESTVSLYESGKQNLTIETLKKVADALDLQFEVVFK